MELRRSLDMESLPFSLYLRHATRQPLENAATDGWKEERRAKVVLSSKQQKVSDARFSFRAPTLPTFTCQARRRAKLVEANELNNHLSMGDSKFEAQSLKFEQVVVVAVVLKVRFWAEKIEFSLPEPHHSLVRLSSLYYNNFEAFAPDREQANRQRVFDGRYEVT